MKKVLLGLFIIVALLFQAEVFAGMPQISYTPSHGNLFCCDFVTTSVGFVGGEGINSGIWKTTTAGSTWYQGIGVDTTLICTGIDVDADGIGFAVCENKVFKTTDMGEHWDSVAIGVNVVDCGFRKVLLKDSIVLIAGGHGISDNAALLKSTDFGQTWQIYFLSFNTITSLLIYNNDLIASTFFGCWKSTLTNSTVWTSLGPLDGCSDIASSSGSNLFTIGFPNKIYRSTDIGGSWTPQSLTQGSWYYIFQCLDFATANFGYIGGVGLSSDSSGGIIYQTTNGGASWQRIYLNEPSTSFNDICSSGSYTYIVGNGGQIVRIDNDAPLPVELASFTSSVSANNVVLNWATVSETNNAGFKIERSTGETGIWTTIGSVDGNGTTNISHTYTYADRNLSSGSFHYRLLQTDYNGNYEYFNLNSEVIIGIPTQYSLSQNYPNPFNPTTKIQYSIPYDGVVSIKVFDLTGKEVATLANEFKTAGFYIADFSAGNVSSGVYFYKLQSGNFTETKKMMLLK